MCLDCGCNEPNNAHGDSRHITLDNVKEAAQASGISVEEAMRNIQSTWQSASKSGQGDLAGSAKQDASSR